MRRRIASEREGLSFCCLAHVSIADLTVSGRRTVRTGSRPVAGRPGFLGITFSVDGLTMFRRLRHRRLIAGLVSLERSAHHASLPLQERQRGCPMNSVPANGRRYFIGGSDARIIMGDDEGALLRLWREKRGEVEPEDLSGNLVVQLGVVTEELNRNWYQANTGQVLTDIQRQIRHPALRW